jgi:heme/copper-type cytochrome/quinol oxidase subunit 4
MPTSTSAPPPVETSRARGLPSLFVALLLLTTLELGIATRLDAERAIRITALCGLAITKGTLLLWSFMHLGRQPRGLRLAVLTPLLVSAGFAVVLMLDAVVRLAGAR